MTLRLSTTILLITGACVGCSSSKAPDTGIDPNKDHVNVGGANGFGGDGTSLGGTIASGGSGAGVGAGTGIGGLGSDSGVKVCGGQSFEAEPEPTDIYVMFDQSSSMIDCVSPAGLPPCTGTGTCCTGPGQTSYVGTSWWDAAKTAMTQFVNDPKAGNMGVGLQFFPLNGIAPASCTADYSTPLVEIGLLPGNTAKLQAAIQAEQSGAFTPTSAALQGAIKHMKAWGPAHPGRAPVVALVTDGFPTECDPTDITDIAAIAKTAFTTEPSVRTFVIGFQHEEGLANLKEIASAGGGSKPFLITGGDIGSQFVNAMLSISSSQLQCEFDVPKPADMTMTINTDEVAVTYTPNDTKVEGQVLKLGSSSDCDLNNGQGWYFNIPPPSTPTKIEICPGTCSLFAAGAVKTYAGCVPVVGATH